jgi:hypothetical protein
VKLTVYVNGKATVRKSGHSIRRFTLSKLPAGDYTVKIVALQSTGSTLTSVRNYGSCSKARPKTHGHHAHSRRRGH